MSFPYPQAQHVLSSAMVRFNPSYCPGSQARRWGIFSGMYLWTGRVLCSIYQHQMCSSSYWGRVAHLWSLGGLRGNLQNKTCSQHPYWFPHFMFQDPRNCQPQFWSKRDAPALAEHLNFICKCCWHPMAPSVPQSFDVLRLLSLKEIGGLVFS